MKNQLLVNEIFGPTLQGEGRNSGKLCYFIRLSGCSHFCSWCDSAQTWRFNDSHPHNFAPVYKKENEVHRMSVDQVVSEIMTLYYTSNFDDFCLIISGGEPMLQSEAVFCLIEKLNDSILQVMFQIETTGTIFNQDFYAFENVQFNISPKLSNSGNPKEIRYKPEALSHFNYLASEGSAIFKFVVSDVKDFDEIEEIIGEVGIQHSNVWIMLEGETQEKQQEKFHLVDEIIKRGFNFSPRLHTMLWGNKRGV